MGIAWEIRSVSLENFIERGDFCRFCSRIPLIIIWHSYGNRECLGIPEGIAMGIV